MTTTTGESTADRQRQRASRGIGRSAGPARSRLPSPPRQRKPAMAALAVLLIVGGALLAGLLAIRMDSRVPVLTVNRDIPAGTQIQASDLAEVQVASEDLNLVDASLADQVAGKFTTTRILADQLIDRRTLSAEGPLTEDGKYALVSVLLSPGLAPEDELADGDVVKVIRAAGQESSNASGETLTEAYVVSKSRASKDDFGGTAAGTVTLLVPVEAAEAVVDAAGSNRAGLAVLSHDNALSDLTLSVAGD